MINDSQRYLTLKKNKYWVGRNGLEQQKAQFVIYNLNKHEEFSVLECFSYNIENISTQMNTLNTSVSW